MITEIAAVSKRLPTVAQMVVRSNSGHFHALARIADGVDIARPCATDGEIRGWRTVLSTLRRWQCIAVDNGRLVLLERGAALLGALKEPR